ncbi:YvaD family protein, partial [Escherichia coli]|nr:YvaD family protein [Escherichia coli]
DHPFMIAWNWSFFPLDILISVTGLYSLHLQRVNRADWKLMALISLVLTCCSGLQALSFWTFSSDFDLVWWLFNGYLLIYPLFFFFLLLKEGRRT